MSHGPGAGDVKAEPNLTPLLDVVLQLLMFFIISANFATQQVSEHIHLPVMQSARPLDQREMDILFLNLTKEGAVEIVGKDPMKRQNDIKTFLRTFYSDAQRSQGKKAGDVKTVVVIRADQSVAYKDVYQLMHWCKEIGFRKFQMRAMNRPT